MDDLKIGDLVRIIGPHSKEDELVRRVGFSDEMKQMIGDIHEIVNIREALGGMKLYTLDADWVWCREWLELANENLPTEEEFFSVFE